MGVSIEAFFFYSFTRRLDSHLDYKIIINDNRLINEA